jgi:hypothetical protein
VVVAGESKASSSYVTRERRSALRLLHTLPSPHHCRHERSRFRFLCRVSGSVCLQRCVFFQTQILPPVPPLSFLLETPAIQAWLPR